MYQWRKDGEFHLFNPQTIHSLQKAVRTGDYEPSSNISEPVNNQSESSAPCVG
jgi:glutamate synthase domain-containing protein 2